MNYKESRAILQRIKKAKKVLITSHKNPDADSTGSIIALHLALSKIGVSSDIARNDKSPEYLLFLPKVEKIKKVDFSAFRFNNYDLIISLDSSRWDVVFEGASIKPNLPTIVIDHHISNTRYGEINLVDTVATSTCEIVYKIFTDCKLEISEHIANNLLAGIIGDTGSFRYPQVTAGTFEIAAKLINAGADRDKIIYNLFFCTPFADLKYLSVILQEATIDGEILFAAIPYRKYKALGKPEGSGFAGAFFQTVKDTKIGILMVEKEKGSLEVSFRARGDLDVSKISMFLGGGGHKRAAGATIKDLKFEDAVEKVLQAARAAI